MVTITVAVLQLLFAAALVVSTPNVCPTGWQYLNGRCWKYQSTARTWNDADNDCRSFDGSDVTLHIADPRSSAENDLLNTLGCRTNSATFPSAWNVWTGNPTSAQFSEDRATFSPVIDHGPYPKFVCACSSRPSNPRNRWCVANPQTTNGVRVGIAVVGGTCTNAPSNNANSCPQDTETNHILCQVPPTPASLPRTPVVACAG
jgi:hypothetical protein